MHVRVEEKGLSTCIYIFVRKLYSSYKLYVYIQYLQLCESKCTCTCTCTCTCACTCTCSYFYMNAYSCIIYSKVP